jgi:glutathione S-transferase
MITLWGRNNSTNVKKVRWALEELDSISAYYGRAGVWLKS